MLLQVNKCHYSRHCTDRNVCICCKSKKLEICGFAVFYILPLDSFEGDININMTLMLKMCGFACKLQIYRWKSDRVWNFGDHIQQLCNLQHIKILWYAGWTNPSIINNLVRYEQDMSKYYMPKTLPVQAKRSLWLFTNRVLCPFQLKLCF